MVAKCIQSNSIRLGVDQAYRTEHRTCPLDGTVKSRLADPWLCGNISCVARGRATPCPFRTERTAMLRSIQSIQGFQMGASNGAIGRTRTGTDDEVSVRCKSKLLLAGKC